MSDSKHEDTLFLDPLKALAVARQANRVQITAASTGLQVCYYVSQEELSEHLPNLIHVHPSQMVQFFAVTRLRVPSVIDCPDGIDGETRTRLITDLEDCLGAAQEQRRMLVEALVQACRCMALPPARSPSGLRVMGWASRTTVVMQHAVKGLVDAFARMGHETRFVIEGSDIEGLAPVHILQEIHDFRPHLTINVNHLNNQALPRGTANVIWWHDMMPELVDPSQVLPWRDSDLVYSLDQSAFRKALLDKGLPLHRQKGQHACIDETIYRQDGGAQREPRTIVFVGTSYRADGRFNASNPVHARFLAMLAERIHAGEVLTVSEVEELGRKNGNLSMLMASIIWNIVIRDDPVLWMCDLAKDGWKVEVYGQGWEKDPVARPFHRGVLRPGRELAALYQRASHALSTAPNLLNHQRLAEIACCGCAPVVYDCRRASEPPHWDDGDLLYFRERESFHAAVDRRFTVDAERFRRHFSYGNFAARILDDLRCEGLLPAMAVEA